MLLQLSEWQQARTSLSLGSTAKQRRKSKSSSNNANDGHPTSLEAALSIIPCNRRNRHTKRRNGDHDDGDVIPMVVVTTAHGIAVVGKAQHEKDEESNIGTSARMLYSSRPGKHTSFLPQGNSCTRIPAFVDGKNELVYAMQNQNSVIACWDANGGGPDDSTANCVKVSLSEAAESMDIYPRGKGIPFGTLIDGSFFTVVWDGDSPKVQKFESPQAKSGKHVCTIMTHVVKSVIPTQSGSKRKIVQDNEDNLMLVQIIADSSGFLVIRHNLCLLNGSMVLNESETSSSRTDVVVSKEGSLVKIDPCHLTHSHNGESIAIMYKEVTVKNIINGKMKTVEDSAHKLCHISLWNGLLTSQPFAMPASTRHFGFIEKNLLAVASIDSISLYEVRRGIFIRSINVADVVSDTKNWCLTTDSNRGTLAILSAHDNELHVAVANVVGKSTESPNETFDLADCLKSAMISNSLVVAEELSTTTDLLGLLKYKGKKKSITPVNSHSAVTEGLASISACLEKILDPTDETITKNALLVAYESALSRVLPASWSPPKFGQNGTKKGVQGSNTDRFIENTHLLDRGQTPPITPQEFIDGAMSLMIATLKLPRTENQAVVLKIILARLDARLIFYRLIRSGKISARRHFLVFSEDDEECDLLFSVLRAVKVSNKRGHRLVTPVDVMHEMLSCCADITERQLVTMIHYMMCKALPDDVAENFFDWRPSNETNARRMLAKEYFKAKSTQRKLRSASHNSEDEIATLQESIDNLSMKLLKTGLTFLVERIVTYAKVNDALLRTALTQGLSYKGEPPALARVLFQILGMTDGRFGLHQAATKWLFVLCEACRDYLSTESPNGTNHMSLILDRVRANVEINSCIMTLGPHLETLREARHESQEPSSKKQKVESVQKSRPVKLAAYSIEHLIF